jgi:hypothetical protein
MAVAAISRFGAGEEESVRELSKACLRFLADRLDNNETGPQAITFSFNSVSSACCFRSYMTKSSTRFDMSLNTGVLAAEFRRHMGRLRDC